MNRIRNEDFLIYLNYLLKGNKRDASMFCHNVLSNGASIVELYEGVMKSALYQVGYLWEQNKITIAEEHLASAITEGIMNEIYYESIIPKSYEDKKVVLACVDKEEHQVGIKMVADVFEMNRWESFFLGTGFPLPEIVRYIKEVKPMLLAISLTVYFNFSNLIDMVDKLRLHFPDLIILIGGQAFNHIQESRLKEFEGVKYISDLNELEAYISKIT